jgi:hypothetical protein
VTRSVLLAALFAIMFSGLYPQITFGDGGHQGGCYTPNVPGASRGPLSPSRAQSACAAIRNIGEFANCVNDVASFQCRNSLSFEELKDCFVRAALAIIGNRTSELEKSESAPLCLGCDPWFLPGLYACSIFGTSGAPEEWCFRNDVDSVSWCEGDPPNHKCKKISCPLSTCTDSSDVYRRCGMVWRPGLK